MRRVVTVILLSVAFAAGELYAACKTDACREATAWKHGYTAIVLDEDITRDDYFGVLDAVRRNNGAVAIETERVLLGWVAPAAAANLRATRGVRTITVKPVAQPSDLVRRADGIAALGFYNRVLSGEYEDTVEKGLSITGPPMTGCVDPGTTTSSRPGIVSANAGADVVALNHGGFHNPNMTGRVTVQVFRMDSDGTVDTNEFTWTSADFNYAYNQVMGAFHFWANQATARSIPLSFRVNFQDPYPRPLRAYTSTKTKYEPIRRPHTQDYLWINDALAMRGFGANPVDRVTVFARNRDFNEYWRNDSLYGPYDGSFTTYVVYNPSPAPSTFTDTWPAYVADYDGPFATVMWNSQGWGPQNLGRMLTHETGHIFWACDEYSGACITCEHCHLNIGPRNQLATPWIKNRNCDLATDCEPRVGCMMAGGLNAQLCAHTPGQLGW